MRPVPVIPRKAVHDRISPEALYRLYREGETLGDLGEKFGVSRERVRQLIERHEVNNGLEKVRHLDKAGRRPDKKNRVISLASPTISVQELAEQSGSSKIYVRQLVKKLNLPYKKLRKDVVRTESTKQQIIDDYQSGMRINEICKKYKFSNPQSFNRFRERRGVLPRSLVHQKMVQ